MKIISAIFLVLIGVLLSSLWFALSFYKSVWILIKNNNEVSAIILTALIAAFVAIWGIFSQRAISRRTFTIKYLSDKEIDNDLIVAKNDFARLSKDTSKLVELAGSDKDAEHDAKSVRTVLNDFELISIGIQKGVIDFDIYKSWYKSGTIDHWNKAEPFIAALRRREGNPMLYHEFEAMVGWLRGTVTYKRGYIIGHWFW